MRLNCSLLSYCSYIYDFCDSFFACSCPAFSYSNVFCAFIWMLGSLNDNMDFHMRDNDVVCKPPMRESQIRVTDYIESTFKQILENIQIRPCGHPSIVLKRIADAKTRGPDDCWEVVDREMRISFPGKTKEEAWRFSQFWSWSQGRAANFHPACVSKILSEIYSAINAGEIVTKRSDA